MVAVSAPALAQPGTAGPLRSDLRNTGVQAPPGFTTSEKYLDVAAPVASLVLPGTGQLLTGTDRGVLYLVAEAFLLARFFTAAGSANREGDRFRDLAFSVARAPFSPEVRDTTFEYFEQMEKFLQSGPFDADPSPGIQPPTDGRTFNSSIWALARRTFLPSPDAALDPTSGAYQRALDFYRSRAIGPNFRWSWAGAEFEQDAFSSTINRSNAASRRKAAALGFLLANHVLSALDAFISRRLSSGAGGASFRSGISGDVGSEPHSKLTLEVVVPF